MIETGPDVVPSDVSSGDGPALREISVRVDAGGEQAFFIVLGADGSVRRRGAKSPDGPGRDLVICTAQVDLFEEVRALITPELLRWCRPANPAPPAPGELRELEVRLQQADGRQLLSRWQSDGAGGSPPPQVIEFAAATVKATNRWYERQKAQPRTRPGRRDRPGWHLVS